MTTGSTGLTAGHYAFADGIEPEVRRRAVSFLDRKASDFLGDGIIEVERLQGGASNVNLRLVAGGRRYALRLCDPEARRWGVDRAASIQAQQDAAELGLAPRILASELPSGDFLAEYADGVQMTAAMLADDTLVARVARTLRTLNAGTTTSQDFSPFDDARIFIEHADAEKAPRPDRYDEMLARLLRVEALFATRDVPRGFCHSDSSPTTGFSWSTSTTRATAGRLSSWRRCAARPNSTTSAPPRCSGHTTRRRTTASGPAWS